MVVDSDALPQDSTQSGSFVRRPFPPPSLENVPLPYILDQLHNLAPHYWDKPETADCTILVPIFPPRGKLERNSTPCTALPLTPPSSPEGRSSESTDPAGRGRRATEPSAARVTRMTSKLHLDYLLAQSALFRALFSGRPPLEHLTGSRTNSPAPTQPSPPPGDTATPAPMPASEHQSASSRQPRILPSTPLQPIVYLPLPHPASFPHLVHYMYFGTTDALEDALNRRQLRWADVVRNVEYLGMRTRMKVFLGRWYAQWLAPERTRARGFGIARRGNLACRSPRPMAVPVVCEEPESDEDGDYDGSCSGDGSESASSSRSAMEGDSVSESGADSESVSEYGDGDSDADSDLDMDENRRMDVVVLRHDADAAATTTPTTPMPVDVPVDAGDDLDPDLDPDRHRMEDRPPPHPAADDPFDNAVSKSTLLAHRERERGRSWRRVRAHSDSESASEPVRGRTRVRSRPNAVESSPRRWSP